MSEQIAARPDGALSEVLRSSRLRSGLLSRARVHSPFAVHATGGGQPIFHAVVAGRTLVRRDAEPTAVELAPGDIVVLPRGDGHTLLDAPTRVVVPLTSLEHSRTRSQIELFSHPGSGPRTDVLCGSFTLAHPGGHALFAQLPPLLVVRGGERQVVPWLHETLERLDLELDRDMPGADELITRLVDVLVAHALGRSFEQISGEATGWICALRDAKIGRAIAAIHRSPADEWSATSLAAHVGMSRSAFFARFAELVGEPPAAYLARWRMHVAADLMSHGELSMGQVAERVGYGSEHAFGKVFKRVMGLPPGEYRRQQRDA